MHYIAGYRAWPGGPPIPWIVEQEQRHAEAAIAEQARLAAIERKRHRRRAVLLLTGESAGGSSRSACVTIWRATSSGLSSAQRASIAALEDRGSTMLFEPSTKMTSSPAGTGRTRHLW